MTTPQQTQALVDGFARAWAEPGFERFMALLHPDVTLLQPVTKPIRGIDAARAEFRKLLGWIGDLRGVVDHSAIDGDVALISWRLTFTLGNAPYELRIVDRIVVADGKIIEREAYYDSLGLMIELLKRPASWAGYCKYRGYT